MNKTQIDKIYWMSNASLKRQVFYLFLKTLVSEMVHSSAGREFHDAGPVKEKPRDLLDTTPTSTDDGVT